MKTLMMKGGEAMSNKKLPDWVQQGATRKEIEEIFKDDQGSLSFLGFLSDPESEISKLMEGGRKQGRK